MDGFLVAAVVIFAIALAVALYAIKRLGNQPIRIAAVIGALAVLLGAIPPVFESLKESPSQQVEAPTHPAVSGVTGR
ncbi:hypothetical protein AB0R12_09730 [Streptomyces niveus]|uniref:hypothetical protein n=1 Tax=Streptomyces niveus TaxID=193462 RepID=UPI003429D7BD